MVRVGGASNHGDLHLEFSCPSTIQVLAMSCRSLGLHETSFCSKPLRKATSKEEEKMVPNGDRRVSALQILRYKTSLQQYKNSAFFNSERVRLAWSWHCSFEEVVLMQRYQTEHEFSLHNL